MAFTFKIILGTITIIFFILSIYLVVQNRASEKVLSSFLTVLLVGSAGTLVTTLFSLTGKSENKTIVKSYVFNKVTKVHIGSPLKPYMELVMGRDVLTMSTFSFAGAAIKEDPNLSKVTDKKTDSDCVDEGRRLYEKVLFCQLIEVLTHFCNFDSQAKRYGGLGGVRIMFSGKADKSQLVEYNLDFFKKMSGIRYLSDSFAIKKSFYVPKGTTISGDLNHINIKNSFMELLIETSQTGGGIGAGVFRHFMGLSPLEDLKHYTAHYRIHVSVKFNSIKSGHPKMKKCVKWSDTIFDQINYYFNSKEQLNEALKSYSLTKDFDLHTHEEAAEGEKIYHEWFESQRTAK
jgi:hypothetical protein